MKTWCGIVKVNEDISIEWSAKMKETADGSSYEVQIHWLNDAQRDFSDAVFAEVPLVELLEDYSVLRSSEKGWQARFKGGRFTLDNGQVVTIPDAVAIFQTVETIFNAVRS